MKIQTRKGFTLTELLIVMAIIVVLAAVAVPTFGKQLETSRETGDMEIIRNAYTEALSIAILDAADGKINGILNDGTSNPTAGTWDNVSFVVEGTNGVDSYYQVDLAKMNAAFSQRALDSSRVGTGKDGEDKDTNRKTSWKYVSSTFMDRLVPIVDTDKTKLNFQFVIVTKTDIDSGGQFVGKNLTVGDVVLKADDTTSSTQKFAINAVA